jgi:protein-tyrosine phosphatase
MQLVSNTGQQREVRIPGVVNLRDVGGYPAGNRSLTRWRTLLRGGSMHGVTEGSISALHDYGIRTIVDLRRPKEIEADPQPDLGANGHQPSYHQISLLTDEIQQARRENGYLLPDVYRAILDSSQKHVGEAINTLAEPDAFPAIVRCTAGKDRTGIVIALLLRVAGVPDHTIIYDYALSQKSMESREFVEHQYQFISRTGADWEHYRSNFLISPADFMRDALEHLDSTYGGACAYLQEAGVDISTQNWLRKTLVEKRSE